MEEDERDEIVSPDMGIEEDEIYSMKSKKPSKSYGIPRLSGTQDPDRLLNKAFKASGRHKEHR